jgi:hypothetical protein
MPLYNDEIAPGFTTDASDFVNFEDLFPSGELHAPLRVPLGSVTTTAADGTEVTDGFRFVELAQLGDPFGYTLFSELEDYIDLIFDGDWDLENAEATLRTQLRSGGYAYYNVNAYLPRLGQDYTHENSEFVRDLRLRFLILSDTIISEP